MGCTQASFDKTISNPQSSFIDKIGLSRSPSSAQSQDREFDTIKQQGQAEITEQILEQQYERVNGKIQLFFANISSHISKFYMHINTEILDQMNLHKLNATQSKVVLSWKVLIMSLNILRFIGRKTNFNFDIQVFKKFSLIQKSLIGYLQMKYPRGGKGFVPEELMSVFKNFSMVENAENDILKNAGIAFTDPSTADIVKKLKQFFNKIIDQLDSKFPMFQSYMIDKIFVVHDQTGIKKTLSYKIGRKISETVSKYIITNDEELTIASPQIFRIIIKWIDNMDDFLLYPDEQIYEKFSFKTIYVQKDETTNFDVLYPDDFQQFTTILKQRLSGLKDLYKEQINSLRDEMNIFNVNLMKILEYSRSAQKFIPEEDVRVIKYAMFNTKLVSWMLVQKLVFILQCLIKVGKSFENSGPLRRVDLIKFNVTDLMRSMVKGSKKELLKVYENMRQQQRLGNLKIIKIKNRLTTPLNDAMVIFTVKQSFLICQLQLILTESENKTQRLKNIEFLNHFLYELERTPYGVLSELAVVIGFKDNKVNYEDKIQLQSIQKFDIQQCEKNHQQSVKFQAIQRKPFICSSCTLFYHPFQNIFAMKACTKCHRFECCRCIFSKDKLLQDQTIDHRFSQCISSIVFSQKNKKKLGNTLPIKDLMTVFRNDKIFLREITGTNSLRPKDLHRFVKQRKYLDILRIRNNTLYNKMLYENSIYFLVVNFKAENTKVKLLFWNEYINELQNAYEQQDNIYKKDNLMNSFYDFLIFIDTAKKQSANAEKVQEMILVDLSGKDLAVSLYQKNFKTVQHIPFDNKKKISLVLKVQISKTANLDGYQVEESQLLAKKQFIYGTIKKARKELPEIKIVRQNILMRNTGLTNFLLKEICTDIWGKEIKILNISDNKITEISIVFEHLPNLQQLLASKNFIACIKIVKKMEHLQKLICFNNKITVFEGFQNIPNIVALNLSNNSLKTLFTNAVSLAHLLELSIASNQFTSIENMCEICNFPSLQILNMHTLNNVAGQLKLVSFRVRFPVLKKLIINYNRIEELIIDSPILQNLQCLRCQLERLIINSPEIRVLSIGENIIKNIEEILSRQMPNVQKIDLKYLKNQQFKKLPKMECPKLIELNLQYSQIQDIQAMAQSLLPKLETLDCSYTNIKAIPEIEAPMLKNIQLFECGLCSIEKLAMAKFDHLTNLQLKGQSSGSNNFDNKIDTFPNFRMANLKTVTLRNFNFGSIENLTHGQCPQIKELIWQTITASALPLFDLKKLQKLVIRNSSFASIEQFQKSYFQSLKFLELANCNMQQQGQAQKAISRSSLLNAPNLKQITCEGITFLYEDIVIPKLTNLQRITLLYSLFDVLPILILPKLEYLSINYSQLKDISNLSKSSLPNIGVVDLYYNELILTVPSLNLPKLRQFKVSNKIKDFEEFQKSCLPELTVLDISDNQIQYLPQMTLRKLSNLSLNSGTFIKSFAGLANCRFPCLQTINFYYCQSLQDQSFPAIDFPSLTSLSISSCNINSFDKFSQSNLPKLETLSIYDCPIEAFPTLSLQNLQQAYFSHTYQQQGKSKIDISNIAMWECPKLKILTIDRFKFASFPAIKMQRLATLHLLNNDIEDFDNFESSNLPNLSELQITDSKKLSKILSMKRQLKKIVLDNNGLIDLNFLEGNSIEQITVSNNKIEDIDKVNFQKIVSFVAYGNLIKNVPSLKSAPLLSQLDLTENQICEFPEIAFPSLGRLILSNNKLTKFNIRKDCCPMLYSLYLTNNQIAQIKQLNCPSLNDWNITNNLLTEICCFESVVFKDPCFLYLSENKIKKILKLPNSSVLQLRNNELTDLSWLANKKFMDYTYIDISNNKIKDVTELSNQNKGLSMIYSLNLDNNQIQSIDFKRFKLPKLTDLHLQNNKLTRLEINSSGLPSLNSLYVSGNQIKTLSLDLPEIYSIAANRNRISAIGEFKINKATQLELNNNQIGDMKWLRKAQCPSLSYLDLSSNEIKEVENFELFGSLYSLNLDDNPLQKITIIKQEGTKSRENLQVMISSNKISDKAIFQKLEAQLKEIAGTVICKNVNNEESNQAQQNSYPQYC